MRPLSYGLGDTLLDKPAIRDMIFPRGFSGRSWP